MLLNFILIFSLIVVEKNIMVTELKIFINIDLIHNIS